MTTTADVATLSNWISHATRRLSHAGVPSPRHDAERLAAHGLGIRWGQLWARLDDAVHPDELEPLCGRRASGEPLGYILGSVEFFGLEITCGPGVLVPRPETETLVDVALELISGVSSPSVCDVGTGSGAVAIAIAVQRPDARVTGTDISADALAWAERNTSKHSCRVELVAGSIPGAAFDLVVSNPPYVPDGALVPADVAAEPPEAVFAGPRGDEMLVWLAEQAGAHKAMALEVGTPEQAASIEQVLARFGVTGIRNDHTDRPRVVWMRRRRPQ
jgi:release factor glutamine methyltransferase